VITFEQAQTVDFFHYGTCTRKVGKRGGVTIKQEAWRRNGKTKTWKTRPGEFSVPIKYGLWDYGYVTDKNAQEWHAPGDPGCMA
jgi:hypothetical protein